MKTRVLLTMLIIFIIVAGVCITCGTVFVVREIDVVDATIQEDQRLTEIEKKDIAEKSGLRGKNILFNLNQEKVVRNLKSIKMLKVQSVTAKFPNHVTLVISRRVPMFFDEKNSKMFDAEMCVVEGTQENYVDISETGLVLDDKNLNFGDFAVGKNEHTKNKIQQLKLIGSFIDNLDGLTRIAYNDNPIGEVPTIDHLELILTLRPKVTFVCIIKPNEDLRYMLEYINQVYLEENKGDGEYRAKTDAESHVTVEVYVNGVWVKGVTDYEK